MEREPKIYIPVKRRREIRISLTPNCNYRCIFCHNEGVEQNSKIVKITDNFFRLLESLIEKGYFDITLTGGEPLLFKKDIYQIVDFINSKNYTITPEITIVTNGSLINDEFATRIMAYRNLKVNISIHSFNNTIYQELTNQTKVKLEQVLENVRLLVDKKIKTKINYVVVKNKNNHDEQILEAVKVITIGVIVE